MEQLLFQLVPVIRAAGGMIRAAQTEQLTVTHKGAADFVTDLDVKIQRYLVDEFTRILPGAGFYGEEDGLYDIAHDDVFVIDPIDGTINMMFGGHLSCVSVALLRRGETELGVVYDPYMDELFTAVRGGGAYCNGRPLHPENRGIAQGLCLFGCSREKHSGTPAFFDIVRTLYDKSLGIRHLGTGALGLCAVATGYAVSYLELELMPYDCAAAVLLVREAGGTVTRADGAPLTLNGPTSILAAMPDAWRDNRAILHQILEATL